MYTVTKRLEISAAHKLTLDYPSPCTRLHGHNWIIEITCQAKELNEQGMVVDFKHIKSTIECELDHRCLNNVLPCNPTAENIAKWICDKIPNCVRVKVQESEGNVAIYDNT